MSAEIVAPTGIEPTDSTGVPSANNITAPNLSNGTAATHSTPDSSLQLPHSSKDGIIQTPFDKPLEQCTPAAPAELTAEQQTKYNTLLTTAKSWTEVPDGLAKGASSSALSEDERMFMTRECLLRYLRADKWNVAQAETRLRNTLSWRREYGLKKLTQDYISIENETGKQVILGWDREGRTCLYLRPHKQNTEKSDRQIEHLVYMLERTIDIMPPGQETLALIMNFAETRSGQSATFAQGKQTMYILQNHYPERLGRALVSNVPFLINAFLKLIQPFIDPNTKTKIRFNEPMTQTVPAEQLSKECGGEVEFEYDHSKYWPALHKLCELKRGQYRERWIKAGSRVGESEVYLRGGDAAPVPEDMVAEKAN